MCFSEYEDITTISFYKTFLDSSTLFPSQNTEKFFETTKKKSPRCEGT
jgi:hypothetical protein